MNLRASNVRAIVWPSPSLSAISSESITEYIVKALTSCHRSLSVFPSATSLHVTTVGLLAQQLLSLSSITLGLWGLFVHERYATSSTHLHEFSCPSSPLNRQLARLFHVSSYSMLGLWGLVIHEHCANCPTHL